MNTNSATEFERLLYKLIIQFLNYSHGSNDHLDKYLFIINKCIKEGLNTPALKSELQGLSKTLGHIPKTVNLPSNSSTEFDQQQKDLINQLLGLIPDNTVPAKLNKKYSQIKYKSKANLNSQDSKKLIYFIVSMINEIRETTTSIQQDTENFLSEISNQLSSLGLQSFRITSSNILSNESSEELEKDISSQINKIKSSYSIANDIPGLQVIINEHLDALNHQLFKYKEIESNRYIGCREDLKLMTEKMHDMQVETDALRNKLKNVRDLALRDKLTQLPNRAAYDERVLIEYYRWYRYQDDLSIIIWDIDLFKNINDTFGHKAGDNTLLLVANLIQEHCRESDFVARYGGEEFVMLLPHTNSTQAINLADKIRIIISQSGFNHQGKDIKLTISSGISSFLTGDDLDTVFNRADKALYQSKDKGRNCCTILIT